MAYARAIKMDIQIGKYPVKKDIYWITIFYRNLPPMSVSYGYKTESQMHLS